ncbi:LAME_0B05072g1_1 [Lachancea meyersii CBS 8951]|uniref:LAME_0B05072g1_1 n=1 Tax=Lachancea meyersii CBS 8951 TaxID=1266667 RepID=A0A1G4IV49_9SACH|nr:LAME_0B05072g1_1 [Lachancea meyersii CBS 8951]
MTMSMSLKVLYTVDNEASSYLTRSKTAVDVRVENISSPNNDGSQIKIGMVELNDVLDEICASSPELFSIGMDANVDYNVYCKDICEVDEPLVSFGLLSKLRRDPQTRSTSASEQHTDWPLVIGRVCSNFSAMLRFQNQDADSASQRTLEIKMRFSKVATANSSRRSSISGKHIPLPMARMPSSANSANSNTLAKRLSKTTELCKPHEHTAPLTGKRQTNPKPAPKAVRTQSLPIWDQTKNNQFALPTNSIAHKIYLADRAAKEADLAPRQTQDSKRPVFQISSLQHDNTVQKTKIDDSVSKRFDFITKKKGKMGKPSIKKPVAKLKSTANKKVRRDSIPNTNISTPVAAESLTSIKNDEIDDFKLLRDEDLVQQLLGKQKLKPIDYFEAEQPDKSDECENKENIPPRMTPASSRFEDLLGMDLPSSKTPSDVEKALNNPRSDDPMEWFNDLFGSPVLSQKGATPIKDPLTCNTLPIEDEEHDALRAPTSDLDRTSPMDTLSMPLYELEQRKEQMASKAAPSCKDQLQRIPLLAKTHNDATLHDIEDDAPLCLNTSPLAKAVGGRKISGAKRPAPVPSSPVGHEDYVDDDYMQENCRKRKTMPSSPTSMFPYSGTDEDADIAALNDSTVISEEFSIHEGPGRTGIDSTPATQYRSSDGEDTKHKEEHASPNGRRFSHI